MRVYFFMGSRILPVPEHARQIAANFHLSVFNLLRVRKKTVSGRMVRNGFNLSLFVSRADVSLPDKSAHLFRSAVPHAFIADFTIQSQFFVM